jgi:hypothetical protein
MKVTVKIGQIETEPTDILINWAYIQFKSGPEPFAEVINQAKSQVYYSTILHKDYLKFCDCISTIPGETRANLIIHSICPDLHTRYSESFFHIKITIDAYRQGDNLCRFVSMTIPDYNSLTSILDNAVDYFSNLEYVEELVIYCKTEKQQISIEEALKKVIKKEEKWYIKLFNAIFQVK